MRTVNVAGTLTGNYTATGSRATTVNLSASSISGNVAMGRAAGVFNCTGGTLDGTLSGGNGVSAFNVNVGAGQVRTLANVTQTLGQVQSGTPVLNGQTGSNRAWRVFDGALVRIGNITLAGGGTFAGLQDAGGSLRVDAGATLSIVSNINVSAGVAAKPVTVTVLGTYNGVTSNPFGADFLFGSVTNNGAGYVNSSTAARPASSAAPTGTGGILVQGATIEQTLGVFTGGVEIRPSEKFRMDLSAGGKAGNRTREGQVRSPSGSRSDGLGLRIWGRRRAAPPHRPRGRAPSSSRTPRISRATKAPAVR